MFSLDIANIQLLSTYYFCLASILIFHCVLPDCSVSEPGWLSTLLSIAPFLQISNGKKILLVMAEGCVKKPTGRTHSWNDPKP